MDIYPRTTWRASLPVVRVDQFHGNAWPPDELFPPDVDDAGLPVELDAVDEDPGEPFFDELPVDDWTAQLGDLTVCWLAEPCADRADQLEQTQQFQVDGASWPA